MSQDGNGESVAGKKVGFVLDRKHDNNKQIVIQENLKNLEVKSQKKKYAQACYYGETGQSPLVRPTVKNNDTDKPPVHMRLGTDRIRLRRMYHFNTNVILRNKRSFQNRNDRAASGRGGIFKRSSAQLRIQRIRQQRIADLMQIPGPQKIKLRRRRPDMSMLQPQPTNYTVQVDNRKNLNPSVVLYNYTKHSVCAQLNKKLQAEIQIIQAQNPHEPQMILSEPIHVAGYGVTSTTLHNRFSLL